MSGFASLSCALAAAVSFAGLAQAQPSAYDRFDAAAATSPAERLVLCDTTAFIASRPDLNADRIVVRRIDRIPVILLPPQFVTGGFLYSERYDRLFNKLRAAHRLTGRDISRAQAGPGRALVDLYRSTRWVDHGFAARQDRYCRAFAAENGVRTGF